jgi:dissimilatory sulfite reductase (desulfoviridin) alpha/beta subunit
MDKQQKKEMLSTYRERKLVGGVCAIYCPPTGKRLLQSATDIQRCRNLFDFSKSIGSSTHLELNADINRFGMEAFQFEILQQIEKKETQTEKEFADTVKTLEDL